MRPMKTEILYPFRKSAPKTLSLLVYCIPSNLDARLLDATRPRPGGAREKSGRVGPT